MKKKEEVIMYDGPEDDVQSASAGDFANVHPPSAAVPFRKKVEHSFVKDGPGIKLYPAEKGESHGRDETGSGKDSEGG